MRALLFVLAVVVAVVWAGIPPPLPGRVCPLATRNQLLTCINFMDANLDETITEAEIDSFMTNHSSCIPTAVRSALTGANVITACDTDASGNLTITDWDAPTGCFQLRSRQATLCHACERCGLFISKKKSAQTSST